jgi:GcrA cell cycle regulator
MSPKGACAMEWSEETILRLRELWDEGNSTKEIGRRLGVSKNAIIGKARRIGLEARPSPVRREPESRLEPLRSDTLPPLVSTSKADEAQTPTVDTPLVLVEPPVAPAPQPTTSAPLPRLAPVLARPYGRVINCLWPIGEPGTRSFHFCDSPSEPGKPYCGEHIKLAYTPRIRRQQETDEQPNTPS